MLAQAHVARTVARRAERSLWQLAEQNDVIAAAAIYLNRLSDALFVLTRVLGAADGSVVYWQRSRPASV